MTYAGEFRWNWPVLAGSCVGVALGAALNHYMLNLFGPVLIEEFGWHRSDFALVGSLSLASLLFVPLAGRFTDRYGARAALAIGFTVVPLAFLAFSFMTGDIMQFYVITLVNNLFGVLTTTLVFSRLIVERFDLGRGMALSVVMSGAPLIGAGLVPLIGEIIESEGWRTAYRTLAAISAAGGLVALTVAGNGRKRGAVSADPAESKRDHNPLTRSQFLSLISHPALLLLVGGMFLVNFPQIIVASQLKLVLMESGSASTFATWLVSFYAMAVVAGRFITGLALDRFEVHRVALTALGLPAIGLAAIASPFDAPWVLVAAIALIGVAQGAEGDIGAYITSRTFDMHHYSFAYSFIIAAMGASMALGSIVLSLMLRMDDTFAPFLLLCAAMTIAGALAIYWTGRVRGAEPRATPAPAGPAQTGEAALSMTKETS